MQSMFHADAIRYKTRQISTLAITLALVLSALLPVLLFGQASAGQISERKITMSTSVRAATGVTYTASFKPASSITATGMVIEFCANSPLIGDTCTAGANGNTLEGFDANTSVTADNSWTVDGASDTNTVILTHAGATLTAGTAYTVALSGVVNPTYDSVQPATFYARILTYTGSPTGYTSTSPGSYTDYGGIALTTNNQLTVNARVQEQLRFCVGTVDNTVTNTGTFSTYNTGTDCSGTAFSGASPTVDLGPISSAGASISPVAVASGGNNLTGAFLIQTNAAYGAAVTYFAEQNSSSGRLKVAGAACSGSTATGNVQDAGSSIGDQCFNSNATQADFSAAGTEEFGMTALTPIANGTTTNLTRTADYDGDGTAATGFAWQQSNASATSIASSAGGAAPVNRVLDYELVLLKFAAQAAAITPTGSYTVTSTYIATSTF
jgi:hypothetical protein